jgi:hypothetical protein
MTYTIALNFSNKSTQITDSPVNIFWQYTTSFEFKLPNDISGEFEQTEHSDSAARALVQ